MAATPQHVAADLTPALSLLRAMQAHGHLSAAAEAAGVPQPTATRWMSGLSEAVGVALSTRVGRRSELTDAGAALAAAAEAAHQALSTGIARALEAADPHRGQVVFGFLRTLGTGRVPELLRGFRADHPQVGFTLVEAGHEDLLARISAGTVDLGMTSTVAVPAHLHAAELFREPLVLVVPGGHRLAGRRRARLLDCRDDVFVGVRTGVGLRRTVDDLFAAAGLTPARGFEGDDVETVRGLVAAGLGVAVLPARVGGALSGSAELALAPRAHREIALVASRERRLEPAAASFHGYALRHRFES